MTHNTYNQLRAYLDSPSLFYHYLTPMSLETKYGETVYRRPFQMVANLSEYGGASQEEVLASLKAGFKNAANIVTLKVLLHHTTSCKEYPAASYPAQVPAVLDSLDELCRDGMLERAVDLPGFGMKWSAVPPECVRPTDKVAYYITPKGEKYVERLVRTPYPRPDPVSPTFGWVPDFYLPAGYTPRKGRSYGDSPKQPAPQEERTITVYLQKDRFREGRISISRMGINPKLPFVKLELTNSRYQRVCRSHKDEVQVSLRQLYADNQHNESAAPVRA